MPKINLSFKNDELEIYNWLEKQNTLIGLSNYIKQLLLEDMNRKFIKNKDYQDDAF